MTERLIGQRIGDRAGPTLIVVAGVHGNEPAGVQAARAVIARLAAAGAPTAGELIALVGNVRALEAGRRFLARDLNRQWTAERIAEARARIDTGDVDPERIELVELAGAIEAAISRARGPVFALDLHTTSAAGRPFVVVGETTEHCRFAAAMPLPGIIGLEQTIDGVLTRYLSSRGCVTAAVEGGQSESPAALADLEAVITVAIAAAGLAPAAVVPGWEAAFERLAADRGELPPLIEIVSRQPADDGFAMEPGFANIHPARAGTLLARDRNGEIRAPFDGLVLLPLYQSQGSDGFFYGRDAGAPSVTLWSDVGAFLAAAGGFLAAREAEHNLLLGLCSVLTAHPETYPDPRFATVHERGQVVAAALQTPPHNLILSQIDDGRCVPAIADALAGHGESIPGVLGPCESALAFAAEWVALHGGAAQRAMQERIFRLDRVVPPRPAPGRWRVAEERDRALLAVWAQAFDAEAAPNEPARDFAEVADRWLARKGRTIYLWDDGGDVVSLAGAGGETPRGVRIGPVYTPPERRGRGYASNLVAAVSQAQLDAGRQFCFLFTNLANPTSNAIYQAIGYAPVTDVDLYTFSATAR